MRPILAAHCFKCHGPDEQAREASLRLDVRESAIAAADSGAIPIVPGKPDASELLKRICAADPDLQMPPPAANKPLSDWQRQILRDWIAAGAEYESHWAFQPPRQAALPTVRNANWPRNAIDSLRAGRDRSAQGLSLLPKPTNTR